MRSANGTAGAAKERRDFAQGAANNSSPSVMRAHMRDSPYSRLAATSTLDIC